MPHTKKQPSMLTWPIIRKGLAYILSGKLRVNNGHIPPANHPVPVDFMGICVATNADASMDDYVIAQLRALDINQVRLDFTYGDLESFNARFLRRLIAEQFQVTLHLIQPFANAKNMQNRAEQAAWQGFVNQVFSLYGTGINRVEIGSTINRKRWAGYTVEGFLAAWNIAFNTAQANGISLAGPNVTDFEPIYNIGILQMLRVKNQLPSIHTNNLFSERVSEPERFDHRIFKYRWATCFKYNLVKKARLLKKVTTDFGIKHFISPVAFWAIYRIERLLPDGEQKQADYLARYMLLNAASGALDQAFWGALICHREGLIDDGLNDATYPALERVTHYASVDGEPKNFWHHASFNAMKTVAKVVQGAQYKTALASAEGLEIHHFETAEHEVHACWTINGKVALLSEIYPETTILQAEMMHRDGMILVEMPTLITESPIYLRWPKGQPVLIKPQPSLAKDLAIHTHIEGLQYYPFQQDGWYGMILAKSTSEALLIGRELHPEKLSAPQKNAALRHARNAIWAVPDPRDDAKQVTVKQPVKMYPHKAFLDRFKPSKAKRSWNGAVELLRRGVATAQPVAFFEKTGDTTLKQNFYICDFVKADANVGEMFVHFANGNQNYEFKEKNIIISAEETYLQLAQYLHKMHKNGAYFRDLSGGNVLVQVSKDKQLQFSLIDTARAWFYTHPTPFKYRIADLTRMCNKLHWTGRERFLGLYLANTGKKLTPAMKRAFYLYDFKVDFKRKFGRKGIKKLMQKLKLQ